MPRSIIALGIATGIRLQVGWLWRVAISAVAGLIGHRSIQMIMRSVHFAPQNNRSTVNRLVLVSISNRSTKKGERTS